MRLTFYATEKDIYSKKNVYAQHQVPETCNFTHTAVELFIVYLNSHATSASRIMPPRS